MPELQLNKNNFEKEVLQSDLPVLVDFFASWCPPCKMLGPIISDLAKELKGKLKRYCYGHMKEYYRHFEWSSARDWCCERQEGKCANCGADGMRGENYWPLYSLEVHHIVPLSGTTRYFTAHNLPWNLIGLCHGCHKEIHRVMKPPKTPSPLPDSWEEAEKVGQGVMRLEASLAVLGKR